MIMKPLLFLTASLILLTGCENTSDSSSSIEDKAIQPKELLTTSELIAPEDIKFISHDKIILLADITKQGGGPAYLSVYSDFEFVEKDVTKENDYLQWTTNQNSRILASSIEHNQIEQEFAIPQHLTKLLVQVWFYDGRPALSHEITIANEISIIF